MAYYFPSATLLRLKKCTLFGHRPWVGSKLHCAGCGLGSLLWLASPTIPCLLTSFSTSCCPPCYFPTTPPFFLLSVPRSFYLLWRLEARNFALLIFILSPRPYPSQIFLITGQRDFVLFTNMSALHRTTRGTSRSSMMSVENKCMSKETLRPLLVLRVKENPASH